MPDEAPHAEAAPQAAGAPAAPVAAMPGAPGFPPGVAQPGPEAEKVPMPTSGRQVFRDVRRQLTDAELAAPGVQKIILDDYERAELRCAEMETYVTRFHEADKRAAVLDEQLKTDRSIEVFFGVGTVFGGAIVGLAPYFFDLFKPNIIPGVIALIVGIGLIVGTAIGRAIKR